MSNQSMDVFLEACGARGPLHLSFQYQGQPESVHRVLDQPFALIGRDPKADIVLKEGQISRHHVYLQCIGGRVFCIDLESRTGTHWDRGMRRAGWLDARQAIRIGPYWVRLLDGNGNGDETPGKDTAPSSMPAALGHNSLPEVRLEFLNRGEKAPTWRMTPMLSLVGKAPECRVHLVGRSVGNYHCSLVRTPLGVWVVDLLGPGGVWVRDVMVRCARLEDGDRLQVGRFSMRIHYDTPPVSRAGRPGETGQFPLERPVQEAPFPSKDHAPGELDESRPLPALLGAAFRVTPPGQPAAPIGQDLVMLPTEHSSLQGEVSHQLAPIVQQFGAMQQQMFDQFQQAMMMMFQMFSSMHRDHMGAIREELDRLQELTNEIQSLQTQLSKYPPGSASSPAPNGSTNGAPQPANLGPVTGAAPPPRPQVKPDAARKPSPTGPVASGANSAEPRPTAGATGQSQADIHAWLTNRLVAMQQERQTRWQKLVGFLSKKRSEEAER